MKECAILDKTITLPRYRIRKDISYLLPICNGKVRKHVSWQKVSIIVFYLGLVVAYQNNHT